MASLLFILALNQNSSVFHLLFKKLICILFKKYIPVQDYTISLHHGTFKISKSFAILKNYILSGIFFMKHGIIKNKFLQ